MSRQGKGHVLDLRARDAGLLFDAFDPADSPAPRLSGAARERLLALAKEAPPGAALRLQVGPSAVEARPLRLALSRAEEEEARSLSELFRNGRRALFIGLVSLTLCLTVAVHGRDAIPGLALPKVVEEGLKIIGWVSMWRPIEIFLFDWLPVVRRRRLFSRLARAEIEPTPTERNT